MDPANKTDLDRLTELAHAGAVQASEAFTQLGGRPVGTGEPVLTTGDVSAIAAGSARAPDPASTGVFFEFDGCLDAIIGILFPEQASELLVRRVVGIETGELDSAIVESALMEVGNILASHVASAIADELGSRLLPSIPSLAMEDAESEFNHFIERAVGHEAPRIESRLLDEDGSIVGRLVLVPTV